jgi:hypothetical protein
VRYSSRRSARSHQRATMLRPRATSSRCVMNQPVGERRTPTQRGRINWTRPGYSVENFYFVQRPRPSDCTTNGGARRNDPPNERPARGDNRAGQAKWALGVDGRSRRIQPRLGGLTAPTVSLSPMGDPTFKAASRFFSAVPNGASRPFGTVGRLVGDVVGIGVSGVHPGGTSRGCSGSRTRGNRAMRRRPRRYGAATATLTIFSPSSLRSRLAVSSSDIALSPNCSRNMPPRAPMTVA